MKAAIFDMDGTMVDNMMVHHAAWQKILSDNGLEMSLEEVKENIHGINQEILERLFGDRFTPEDRVRVSGEKEQRYREIFADQLALIPGLPEFLEELHQAGIPMAVASAAPGENVDFVLDGLNLRSYFPVVLHASHVEKGKPNPEIFLKAAAELGVAPADCVVFEDSPTGVKAATAAGCKVVVVTTTHAPAEFTHIEGEKSFREDFRGASLESLQN